MLSFVGYNLALWFCVGHILWYVYKRKRKEEFSGRCTQWEGIPVVGKELRRSLHRRMEEEEKRENCERRERKERSPCLSTYLYIIRHMLNKSTSLPYNFIFVDFKF